MSSVSPGMTSPPTPQSATTTTTLHHPQTVRALATFASLVESCYGPNGRLKTIQNACGGQVFVTSSSAVLTRRLSPSNLVLRLMLAAVEGHLASFSDGGLFAAILMTDLVRSCSTLDLHPVLCGGVNEVMLDFALDCLHSDSCRVNIDVSDAQSLLSLVRSVISTKTACGLTRKETEFICSLTLQAFLRGLPNSSPPAARSLRIPTATYISVEGRTPMDSHIIDGVLVECSQTPINDKNIGVALFNTSLSGGGEGFPDVHLETEEDVSMEDASLEPLLVLGRRLLQLNVGLLACQKVIHPHLKRYLRDRGVVTLDRLSLLHIDSVQMITGARILGGPQSVIQTNSLGNLDTLTSHVMYGKQYVHLQNSIHPMCTYVLCNRTEASLDEMKTVCQSAHHLLGLTLSQPVGLPGAGCCEVYLAAHLKEKIKTIKPEVLKKVGCSEYQFKTAAKNFIRCIESVSAALNHSKASSITDNVYHHRWSISLDCKNPPDRLKKCACGMKSYNPDADWQLVGSHSPIPGISSQAGRTTDCTVGQLEHGVSQASQLATSALRWEGRSAPVLDLSVVKCNALCIAVQSANAVLRIHYIIG